MEWFEVVITCDRVQIRRLLGRVGELVKSLRSGAGMDRWHYFLFEPWGTITVRVRVPKFGKGRQYFEQVCRGVLTPSGDGPEVFLRFGPYAEEAKEYGASVEAVLAFHEAASEIGLLMAAGTAADTQNFHPAKLIHCTLNEWGYDWPVEAEALERMAFWRRIVLQISQRPGGDAMLNHMANMPNSPARREREEEDGKRWR